VDERISEAKPTPPQTSAPVGFSFEGTGLQCLGWGLLASVLSSLVIPTAWGWEYFIRWFFRSVRLRDATPVAFVGRAAQIWYLAVLVIALNSLVPQHEYDIYISQQFITTFTVQASPQGILSFSTPNALPLWWAVLIVTAVFGISCIAWERVLQWLFRSIDLGCGTQLDFTGKWWQLFGWSLLFDLSVLTIVGWAWVAVAIVCWLLDSIQAPGHRLVFHGTGVEVLWRGALCVLVSILTLGIGSPWMFVWIWRWGASNLYVEAVPSGV